MMSIRTAFWFFMLVVFTAAAPALAFDRFITARGGMLMDGNAPFRFVSFNVPNLNYIEDDMRFTETNPYRLPDEFEMRDVFETVNEMGGRVVRIYTVPVKSAGFPPKAPTYVLAPGKFDEDAFRSLDRMMALANEYGVRIIFPLVNNWPWMGGRPQYAAFRGKQPDDFWTDPQLIADFKATILHLLERTNTITGVKYKDDKAILCWETGNELGAPFSWTVAITRTLKSIDHNHLVMDGSRGLISNEPPSIQLGALTEPSIDIVTTHHYESDPAVIPQHIQDTIGIVQRRKVYLVGEFGFAPTAANEAILDKVISREQDVAGALIWSLRFHDRDGGFYWHSEPFGGNLYRAFLWPGFSAGGAYDEIRMMAMIRRKAFAIRGMAEPPRSIPKAPSLLPIENVSAISWRGSMGATSYDVERAEGAAGPWVPAGQDISDADAPYFPLFDDEGVRIGGRYYYRVRAVNGAGASPWSAVAGPVSVAFKVKIDTMKGLGRALQAKAITVATGLDRSFKESPARLAGERGSELTYLVPGRFQSFTLYAFEKGAADVLQILGSADGRTWRVLKGAAESYAVGESTYDYWRPKIYRTAGEAPLKFVKIRFLGAAQLARAEIAYTNRDR